MATKIIASGTVFTNFIGADRLLGMYPGASAAYSLRQVGSGIYAGPLVTIRRSTDNLTMDFYAVNNAVSIDDVKLFVGSGDGTVVTLYDQTGNGLHATQPTAGFQPKVISGGTPVLLNGKPSIMFDGVDDFLSIPQALPQQFKAANAELSMFFVAETKTTASFTVLSMAARDSTVANDNDLLLFQCNGQYSGVNGGVGMFLRIVRTSTAIKSVVSPTALKIAGRSGGVIRSGLTAFAVDGAVVGAPVDMNAIAMHLEQATIGATRRGINPVTEASNPNSKIAEIIMYPSDKGAVNQGIIGNMANYYNTI